MDIGGSCASGGPYQIATPCPAGVDVLLTLGIPLGIVSAGSDGLEGVPDRACVCRSGGPRVARAVPVARLELPGVRGPQPIRRRCRAGLAHPGRHLRDHGRACRCWAGSRREATARSCPASASTTTPIELNELASAMRQVSLRASRNATPTTTVADAMAHVPWLGSRWSREPAARSRDGAVEPNGMIDQLERLARAARVGGAHGPGVRRRQGGRHRGRLARGARLMPVVRRPRRRPAGRCCWCCWPSSRASPRRSG